MMKNKCFFVLSAFFSFFIAASAQQANLALDHAVFHSNTNQYVEFYYSLNPEKFNIATPGAAATTDCNIAVTFTLRLKGKIVHSDRWRVDCNQAAHRSIIDMRRLQLDPGDYEAKLSVDDINQVVEGDSVGMNFTVPNFSEDQVQMSSIGLYAFVGNQPFGESAGSLQRGPFYIVPNPSLVFGGDRPTINFYCEYYQLNQMASKYFYVDYDLQRTGESSRSAVHFTKKKVRSRDTMMDVGQFPADSLGTGSYFFSISLKDSAGAHLVSRNKKIFVYNPNIKTIVEAVGGGSIDQLDKDLIQVVEKDLDDEIQYLSYLISPADQQFYTNAVNPNQKRKILAAYWHQVNKSYTTDSDFRREYLNRVAEVNRLYTKRTKEGWKSDRGRIFMLYGKPDEMEINHALMNLKPHEIWVYQKIENGVQFVFVDEFGFGDYRLIHATARGESQDPNWQSRLQK